MIKASHRYMLSTVWQLSWVTFTCHKFYLPQILLAKNFTCDKFHFQQILLVRNENFEKEFDEALQQRGWLTLDLWTRDFHWFILTIIFTRGVFLGPGWQTPQKSDLTWGFGNPKPPTLPWNKVGATQTQFTTSISVTTYHLWTFCSLLVSTFRCPFGSFHHSNNLDF